MANFFKKINQNKHSPKSKQTYESPPTSELPTPPLKNISSGTPGFNVEGGNFTNKTDNNNTFQSSVQPLINDFTNQPNLNNNTSLSSNSPNSTNRIVSNSSSSNTRKSTNSRSFKTPWKKKKLYNSPFPRIGHAVSSITSNSGALYLMGGLSGNEVYGDMWVLEPIRQSTNNNKDFPYIASPIENHKKVPSPRTGHASILIGNAFIIFAGDTAINDTHPLDNNLYFFNISSLKWTITAPDGEKPCGRYGHKISVINSEISENKWASELFIFGGEINDEFLNDLWKFDLSNFRNPLNKWIKVQPKSEIIPPKLANHSMTASNDKLYIYGGHNDHFINDKFYAFDSSNNSWEILNLKGPAKIPPLFSHSAATYGSLLFIYGGKLSNEFNSDDLFIIDLVSLKCWKLKNHLYNSPGPRYGHSITVDPNERKILIMGGDIYDNDFDGVCDSTLGSIDESNFALSSSVIYECDIEKIEEFIDKSSINTNPNYVETKSILPSAFGKDYVTRSESNINLQDSPKSADLVSSTPLENSFEVDTIPDTNNIDTNNIDTNNNNNNNLKEVEEINTPLIKVSTNQMIINSDHDSSDDEKDQKTINTNSNYSSTPKDESTTNNDSLLYKTPEDTTSPMTLSSFQTKGSNAIDLGSKFLTPSIQQAPNFTSAFSPAVVERDNEKLQSLIRMIKTVKTEMKTSVNQANEQIVKLVEENKQLKSQIASKSIITNVDAEKTLKDDNGDTNIDNDESINNINPDNGNGNGNDNDNEGEREYEHANIVGTNEELQNFISTELSTIPDLKDLLEQQENKIKQLTNELKSEQILKDKIYQLEAENLSLKDKVNIFNIEEDNVDINSDINDNDKNIKSESKSVVINKKLDNLLEKWCSDGPHVYIERENKKIKDLENNYIEINKKLLLSNNRFKELEILYNESKNSLNLSHKALLLSQSESKKYKVEIENLKNNIEDLQMKKRNFSNSNLRSTSLHNMNEGNDSISNINNSNLSGDKEIISDESNIENNDILTNISNEEENEEYFEEGTSLIDDRYAIKIKDLEATLFIVTQERDNLRDELVKIKKQMYNTRNNSNSTFTPPLFSSPSFN